MYDLPPAPLVDSSVLCAAIFCGTVFAIFLIVHVSHCIAEAGKRKEK